MQQLRIDVLGAKPVHALRARNRAWGDDVGTDSMGTFFHREHSGECVDTRFGGGDVDLIGGTWNKVGRTSSV